MLAKINLVIDNCQFQCDKRGVESDPDKVLTPKLTPGKWLAQLPEAEPKAPPGALSLKTGTKKMNTAAKLLDALFSPIVISGCCVVIYLLWN